MLRTQKDVDKHVQDIFRKITNEKERNLRCYNVAKLYHKVGDYQSTKQYAQLYLRDRPDVAGAHKLLGQALEGLKDYSKALEEYKCSLSLESKQPDLVLKVCELLVETKTKLNPGEAQYWKERAEEISENHQAVFRLKEYLLKLEDGSGDQAQLCQLIEKEIEARPYDYVPRVRLLNLYLDCKRILDGYKYAIELERRCLFRDSLPWYSCVIKVLKEYQKVANNLDGEFYVNLLCVRERFVTLCIRDQPGGHSTSLSDALFAFDQACFDAFKYCQGGSEQLLQECIRHMSGQLSFHLGTAWFRTGKQSRTGWKEWTPLAWGLMALAYASPNTNDFISHSSNSSVRDHHNKLVKLWKEDCAFRRSQAGHILLSMFHEETLFSQLSSGNWQERVFKVLFPAQSRKPDAHKLSFFVTDARFAAIPNLSLSLNDFLPHDEASQQCRPDSLHTLVWLGLRYLESASKHTSPLGTSYVLPHKLSSRFACHVFEELKLSTANLESGGVETLNRLDVDTFLYASVFCAAAAREERPLGSLVEEGRVLPIDLTETLCTGAQSKWWLNAYRLHSNKSRTDIGEVRMIVSRGVEVVRLVGNHGMDVRLVVLLAKLFTEKASDLTTPKDNVPDISKRALIFWQCAISMLERLEKNQSLRSSENSLFAYGGKVLTSSEIRMLLEEGRFFMACRFMKENKHEQAIEVFQSLKSPYASFYEGVLYKKLANDELQSISGQHITEQLKSNYVLLLKKSVSAFYLTLDRLRSPQNAGSHPLDLDLEQHLEEVENCIAREDNTFVSSILKRNSHQGLLDDSFISNRFEDSLHNASRFVNTSMHHTLLSNLGLPNGQSSSQGMTSTPVKVKYAADLTSNSYASHAPRMEARPSPERLDAQLRHMTITTDTIMQVVVDQNKQMLAAIERTQSTVEKLQKDLEELKLDVRELKMNENRSQPAKNVDYLHRVHPEEECDYDVASSQFHNLRGFPPTASYAHFHGQSYNYDARASASTVPMPAMLSQALFPQAQISMARNMDPNLLLASYYPQSVGLNYNERQAASGVIPNTVPGTVSSLPGSIAAPVSNNVPASVLPTPAENAPSVDAYRRTSALMGAPLLQQSALSCPPVDMSATASSSVPQSQQVLTSDLSNQRFTFSAQEGPTIPGKMPIPSTESVPHNFQISMPAQATIPTTESLEKCLSPLKPISTEAILPNVPRPTYSAVSVRQPDVKSTRLSTGSASGNDTFTEDADYNPCSDFKPIIPLPEEVTVTTGEEDETVLFVRRAKLFRFVGGEWKERGVGNIKILKHLTSGKPRILMRREQVHKICANHFILPEMELAPQTGSDRAWFWAANDFSDGEPRIEKLCVRFKTVDDAREFKEMFDEGRSLAKNASPVKGLPPAAKTPQPANTASAVQDTPTSSGKVLFGGFSFISPPVLKPVERQAKTSPSKDKEPASTVSKPSPFLGFSFTPSPSSIFGHSARPVTSGFVGTSATSPVTTSPVTTSTVSVASSAAVSSTTPASSLFGSKISLPTVSSSSGMISDAPMFNTSGSLLDFAAIAAQSKSSEVVKTNADFKGFEGAGSKVFGGSVSTKEAANKSVDPEAGSTEDFEPTAVFNPVVPLPSLIEVKTGEEDEVVLFEERAKLLRFDSKEWKERGIGKMKVLKNPSTGKVRLLMRREQVHKVCCNHLVSKDIQFKPLTTSDKAITWSAQDFSEGEVRTEVFALRFKTPELMHSFKDVIDNVQKDLSCTVAPTTVGKQLLKKDAKPLSELFKPAEGSWECNGCFTRNDAGKVSCPCCNQPKPGHEAKVAESKPTAGTPFTFGIKPNSTIDATSRSGFVVGNIATASKDKQPSLAELFKPKEGSWDCQECYTRCDADRTACVACEAPKPGYVAKAAESKPIAGTPFTFGIKPNSTSDVTSGTGFVVGNIATASKDKQPSLAELFKPKEGSWDCQECYTRCDADRTACVACEAPKPGHEKDNKAVSNPFSFGMNTTPSATFSFGSKSSSDSQTTETKSFSFGAPASQTETKATFLFGVPNSTATDSSKGFSFGSSTTANSASSSTGFLFGIPQAASKEPSFDAAASGEPSFGSPHKFEFQMKAQSPGKSSVKSPGAPSGEEESEDDNEEENVDVGDFKPVVPLPDKVPVVTGEEDEEILYSHRAKLYRFADSEWKERGVGDIKVLRHKVTLKPRLLMRREQVLKICLNHFILADLELKPKDEKSWTWVAQDFSEGVLETHNFACRFKTSEIAANFKEAVDDAKNTSVLLSPVSSSASRTSHDGSSGLEVLPPSTKPSNNGKPGVIRSLFGSSGESSLPTDELEVVYEAKVTPEEKSAALKLLLPENFYLYKRAPPCAGCPGCDKDSDSDAGDEQSSIKATATSSSAAVTFAAPVPAVAGFGTGTPFFSSTSFSSPSTNSIFGGSSSSKQTPGAGFMNLGAPALNLGLSSRAVNSHSTAFPLLGFSTPASNENNPEKPDSVSFLPVGNSPSFASLASASSNIFKSADPSKPFTFDGAGSTVFGKSTGISSLKKNNDEEDSGGEHNTSGEVETHDPHFEPIIPMPDIVEVRTGEEDEERVFCQRSKLFRFDTTNKEWKERGVGELKILKNPVTGIFRLLLRREQVHKVVLNQRLDPTIKLNPLNSSDKAWCWAGINHAEGAEATLEELAARFRNSEEAGEFRSAFEECQKQIAESRERSYENDERGEEEDYVDYEDEETEILFEKPVALTAEIEGLENSSVEGKGYLRIIRQSSQHIVEFVDESDDILCRAPIMGDSEVQRDTNVCTWRSTDTAEDEEGIDKKFVTTFETEQDADTFQDYYSKITLEIVERTYDYVDEPDD